MMRGFLLLVALAALTLIAPWAVLLGALVLLPFYGRARRVRAGPIPAERAVAPPLPHPLPGRALSPLEHRFQVISGGLD